MDSCRNVLSRVAGLAGVAGLTALVRAGVAGLTALVSKRWVGGGRHAICERRVGRSLSCAARQCNVEQAAGWMLAGVHSCRWPIIHRRLSIIHTHA